MAARTKKRAKAKETPEAQNPLEAVERLDDNEALNFRALDAELRNHLQGMRLIDLEIEALRRKCQDEVAVKLAQKKQLETAFNAKKVEYDQTVKELAEKRGLDPTKITIDPEAKIIRDVRNESN